MEKIGTSMPTWEAQLRTLVEGEIREQVTSNTGNQDFILMWRRRPFQFIEEETARLLTGCWKFFPAWNTAYDLTSREPLSMQWEGLDDGVRGRIAKEVKDAFYRERGLHADH
jgi:hypothetical protein